MVAAGFVIRDALDADVEQMTAIYNAFISSTSIEWRDEPHTVAERLEWQHSQQADGLPVLVAVDDVLPTAEVLGWTSYGPFRENVRWPGYRFCAEHSIHVAERAWGRGVGRALVEDLLSRAKANGIREMIAAVDGENVESIRFHEKLGFATVGRLAGIGEKHGRRLDLVLMQRSLT